MTSALPDREPTVNTPMQRNDQRFGFPKKKATGSTCFGDVPQRFGDGFSRICSSTGPVMTSIFLAANLPTGHKSEVGLANLAMSSEL